MKNNFIKSTIILIIGGFLSKILGMFIKIVLTRTIGTKGIGLYAMIIPTFNLFITLCQIGLPIAISKVVSEQKERGRKIILPIIPIAIFFNLILIITLLIISPILSKYLLKNKDTYYPLISIGLTLPFICISSILKGYFYGKEKMLPITISNIIEQITRLLLTITIVKKLTTYSLTYSICGVILINIISEGISIITLISFIKNKEKITIKDFQTNKITLKNLLNISIPSTSSRLIGSLCYFLEPIILTSVLTKTGYKNEFITIEYGILNGYVFPLLLLPSFFTLAIGSALLPVISNSYSNKNYTYTKYKIKQAILFSLLIGIPCTIILMVFPEYLLKLIYHTKKGIIYIKIIAPIFLLLYIQSPLTTAMQAMNKSKEAMLGTLYGSIIRTILLFALSYFHIGMWGLLIASSINIILITIHHAYHVFHNL